MCRIVVLDLLLDLSHLRLQITQLSGQSLVSGRPRLLIVLPEAKILVPGDIAANNIIGEQILLECDVWSAEADRVEGSGICPFGIVE